MKRSILLVGLVALFALVESAQTPQSSGFIVGKVTERTTGQPIVDVSVRISANDETKTDSNGNFQLSVDQGIHSVRFLSPGFAAISIDQVAVTGGRNTVLNVALDVTIAENVEVTSQIFSENSEQAVSNLTLGREDLRATPGTAGDPLRAINSQPAVTAASGEFAALIVRGGTAEENLTYIDNIPVGDFTYFTDQFDGNRGGRASILAPDTIDRAEFSAGGFGVRYGDRLSSSLDISLREANRKKIQAVIFADSGTAGGSLDVPFGKRGSWLTSARRSYIDLAFDVAGIADQGIIGYPRTLDFTNKFVFDLTPTNKLTFTALNFFESFEQNDEQAQNIDRRTDRFRAKRTSQRNIFGATLSSTFGSKTLAQTTLWANTSHNDGAFFLPQTSFLQRSRDLRDSQVGLKEDVSTEVSRRVRASFGGGIYLDQANYNTFENSSGFYSPLEEEFTANPRENLLRLKTTASTYAYGQFQIFLTNRFSITPGIRLDRYGITNETLVSPRFAARFNVTGKIALTFAAGKYHQPPSLFVLSLTPNNRGLGSQSATHLIGGIDWLPRDDIRVRFEAYRKAYSNLAVQTVGPTPGFVSDGNYQNDGRGTANGFEISVQKALTGFLSGQASYGFISSRRTINSATFPSDFERPHQLTLIGTTRFFGFNVAAKYRVASGLPYTNRTPVKPFPGFGFFVQRIRTANDINSLRLPAFASLDVRAEKRFGFKRWSVSPYVDIFNVTNHNSVVQPNYEFFNPSPQFLSENKRLPIFGLRIEF